MNKLIVAKERKEKQKSLDAKIKAGLMAICYTGQFVFKIDSTN